MSCIEKHDAYNIVSGLQLSDVCVAGVFLESTTEFTVDARSVVPRGGRVKAFVTAPTGTRTEALVNNINDGTYKCMYTPYEQGMLPAC